jgi:hypothetical protein
VVVPGCGKTFTGDLAVCVCGTAVRGCGTALAPADGAPEDITDTPATIATDNAGATIALRHLIR